MTIIGVKCYSLKFEPIKVIERVLESTLFTYTDLNLTESDDHLEFVDWRRIPSPSLFFFSFFYGQIFSRNDNLNTDNLCITLVFLYDFIKPRDLLSPVLYDTIGFLRSIQRFRVVFKWMDFLTCISGVKIKLLDFLLRF